jgi:hypothetical protein
MPVKGSTKRTNKPEAKAGVIRRRLEGETTREIAKAEGIARNTVIRILSLPEMRLALARSRGILIAKAHKLAERLIQIALGETKKGDRQAIVDTLRGIGVLTSKFELEDTGEEQRTYALAKVGFFKKYGRWPTDEEAIEFDRTIDIEPSVKQSAEFKGA